MYNSTDTIYSMYKKLYEAYGPQGWWPITNYGYHKEEYSFPRSNDELFEVALGSILTQNTTFTSVQKSLRNLYEKDALNAHKIENMNIDELKEAIKPSGYHNQKAIYILEFIKFYKSLNGAIPKREDLLHVKGIGEETADSILLYGYNQLEFKVDAYTKRILVSLHIVDEKAKYAQIKSLMQNSLNKSVEDKNNLLKIYQEFHALIVCHGKKFYSKKPYNALLFDL